MASPLLPWIRMILTPARPIDLQGVFQEMAAMELRGKRHFIIVLSEGAPWSGSELTRLINEADNPYEAWHTALGYVQRGGSPAALDRILATRMGVAAVDALWEGKPGVLGAWQQSYIVVLPADQLPPKADLWSGQLDRVHEISTT